MEPLEHSSGSDLQFSINNPTPADAIQKINRLVMVMTMTMALDSGNQDQVGLPLWSTSNFNDTYVQRSLSVGTGAFSKVYLGSNIAKSAKVAIKVIDRSTLFDEEEKRLAAEIEILRELSHANIISESIQYDFFLSIVVIFIYR